MVAIAPAAAASDVPISAFLGQPQVGQVILSPTGEQIAVTLRSDGKARFRVLTQAASRPPPPQQAGAWEVKYDLFLGDERDVSSMRWVQDDLVLVTLGRRVPRLDATISTGELRSIDVRTGRIRILPSGSLLHTLPDDPDHVLTTGVDGRFNRVYRMNVLSGHTQRIARSANPWGSFVTDAQGDVAFTIGQNEEGRTQVHHREQRERWRLVGSYPFGDQGWRPAWHGPRPQTYFTWDNRGAPSTQGLGLYDVASGTHRMVIRHPKGDIRQVMVDFDGRPYAVRFEHHFPAVQYLDRKHPLAQQHLGVSKAYEDDIVSFTSFSRDHSKAVAFVTGDRNPGAYVFVDFQDKQMTPLVTRKPALPRQALSPVQPVEVRTRDGATVYGYLTSHPQTQKPGPLVVLVHGGPHGVRDYWRFEGEAQLLANRGFHVLQVNYRGSSGYGKAYERAGYGEWGRRMQDDVTDATRWAVQSNTADPERLCIMGVSYGAYSALMGTVREPNLYRCAIGMAGLYDLTLMEKRGDVRRRRAGVNYIRDVIGDDEDELKARSPSHQAHRIRAAVMLVHGGRDLRTPVAHANAMREALERVGKPVEWVFESVQGHGFVGDAAQAELYERVLAFLSRHIGEDESASAPG